MKPSTFSRRRGSSMRSRTRSTERTKKSSPSGNTDDSTARMWLVTMSPSAAKCFGRSSSQASNSMARVGTGRGGDWAEAVVVDMLRAYPGRPEINGTGGTRYCHSMTTGRSAAAGTRGDGRTRRWEGYRAARRAQLVDAAIASIRRHGATVAMEDIAAEAGTSKAGIYRQFAD